MKAKSVKEWCDENLSPMAWSRILTRNLPHFNEMGVFLKDLKNPQEDLVFEEATINIITKSIKDIYDMELFSDKI